jgi:hypothetical protein
MNMIDPLLCFPAIHQVQVINYHSSIAACHILEI